MLFYRHKLSTLPSGQIAVFGCENFRIIVSSTAEAKAQSKKETAAQAQKAQCDSLFILQTLLPGSPADK